MKGVDGKMTSPTENHTSQTRRKIDPEGLGIDPLRYDGQRDDPSEVAGILRALMPSNVSVLDVGCGTGSITVIANRGHDNLIVAVEPDTARAEMAASRGVNVHNCYLDEAFIEKHGQYDVVMSSDVLEHTPDPHRFLNLLVKATTQNGLLLISVPNVAHWSVRLNLFFGRFDYEPCGIMDVTHLRWFTAKSILALFKDCDLEVTVLRHTTGFDLPIYNRGLLRLIPGRLKRPAIRMFTTLFPKLFGVQHVLVAHKAAQARVS